MLLRLSSEAKQDLDEIWDFVASDNPRAANGLIADLLDKAALLARQPRLGRYSDELQPGLYRYPHRSYVLFYRIAAENLEIVRILHGARNLERILGQDATD